MNFFFSQLQEEEIKLKEAKQYKLLNKTELGCLDWADADLPIVKELQTL
jgi:8-oxo-dGTP diphosphatase